MRALLIGYGKMGKLIAHYAPDFNIQIASIVDPSVGASHITEEALETCDIAFDFATPDQILPRIVQLASAKKPLIVGTTGWQSVEKEAKELFCNSDSKIDSAILVSPNFSLGVALFLRLVDQAASLFSHFSQYDLGMNEIHHREKVDAPSGTAFAMAKRALAHYPNKQLVTKLTPSRKLAQDQVLLTAERYGFIPGIHDMTFDSLEDTITLKHSAKGRDGFAKGALASAHWLQGRKGWFTLDDMLNEITTR